MNYAKWIEDKLKIVNKESVEVPFTLNTIQRSWIDIPDLRKIELKARQQGFSSVILAKKTAKFLLMENRYIITIADVADNAIGLLDRVKYYIKTYEAMTGKKVPLKYNSKYELYNEALNSRFIIGTAENIEMGRSKTVTDLHMSEAAFYRNFRRLLASALQAVVPDGEVDIETTANGFGDFHEFWVESEQGLTGFKPLFYPASAFYSPEFLEQRRKELGRLYPQEYPETPIEAFLTTGDTFFDKEALQAYLQSVKEPITEGVIYV